MRSTWQSLFSLALALVVLLACASEDSAAPEIVQSSATATPVAPDRPPVEATEPETEDEVRPEPSSVGQSGEGVMAASSPIGAFFLDDGGFEASLAEFRIRVNEGITICMAEQGFEYRPPAVGVASSFQRQTELTEREWTAEYGYGIATSLESTLTRQLGDPNEAIAAALSEAEREQWETTLRGPNAVDQLGGGSLGGMLGPGPIEEQGCFGQAFIEAGAQDTFEALEQFGMAYAQGEFALQSRPEMVDAVAAWSTCMGDAGYPTNSTLNSPRDRIATRFFPLVAELSAALAAAGPATTQAVLDGDLSVLDDVADVDAQVLRDIQAEERDTALADLACRQTHVRPTYQPLLIEFEEGLLADYGDELGALRSLGSE